MLIELTWLAETWLIELTLADELAWERGSNPRSSAVSCLWGLERGERGQCRREKEDSVQRASV